MATASKATNKFLFLSGLEEIHPDLAAWAGRELDNGASIDELKSRLLNAITIVEKIRG